MRGMDAYVAAQLEGCCAMLLSHFGDVLSHEYLVITVLMAGTLLPTSICLHIYVALGICVVIPVEFVSWPAAMHVYYISPCSLVSF
jgi:hypothetical protein